MKNASASSNVEILKIISYIFGILFIIIGILNVFLVHPVPGILYLIISLIYFPQVNTLLKKKFGFTIPTKLRMVLGFVIMWGTLGVGDLAEMFGL